MNPKILDIQLLLVFEALMAERNVTKAARHVGLSQSALSHALARLRHRLGDPLLIRTAKGMQPTTRALELVGPVRAAIRQVETVFRAEPAFDPLTSKQSFVIRIGDSNDYLLLPTLLQELEARAPQVSIVVRHLSPTDTLKGLEEGTIDCAISALLPHPKSVRSTVLMKDRSVCAMSRDHPLAHQPLTITRFLGLRHIRVVQESSDSRFLDSALRERGAERRIVATIPHWVVALHTASTSQMVVAASERMARRFDTDGRLVLRKIPLVGGAFNWRLYWPRRHEADAGQRWIRGLIAEVCAGLDSDGAPSALN